MIYELDFRTHNVGGAVSNGILFRTERAGSGQRVRTVAGPAAVDLLLTERQILFLIHGFNVEGRSGRERLAAVAEELETVWDGAIVATLWPGDSLVGPFSYPFEGTDADDTAFRLARFVRLHLPPTIPLCFVAHSLGSRVTMEAIDDLRQDRYQVNRVCLMAAAIDDTSLSVSSVYRGAATNCREVVVMSSEEDGVLKWAYPTGDLLQAFFFPGDDSFGFALGLKGTRDTLASGPLPTSVRDVKLPVRREVGHGHYILDPQEPANSEAGRNQHSTTNFLRDLFDPGISDPEWR